MNYDNYDIKKYKLIRVRFCLLRLKQHVFNLKKHMIYSQNFECAYQYREIELEIFKILKLYDNNEIKLNENFLLDLYDKNIKTKNIKVLIRIIKLIKIN